MALSPDISVIITAHHEGRLAHRTMQSVFKASECAESDGVVIEVIVVLDMPDKKTTEYFAEYWSSKTKVMVVAYGDPGLSRNYGIKTALGKYVALLDADDLFGESWIINAYNLANKCDKDIIFYPEYVISFEGKNLVAKYKGTGESSFDISNLFEYNCWNSVHFVTKKSILLAYPFEQTPLLSGFGYEDWHWYCEIIAHGVEISIVPNTSVYYRIKNRGSRLTTHFHSQVLIPPTKLFDPSVFALLVKDLTSDKTTNTSRRRSDQVQPRKISFKKLISKVTDPIFRRYPRLYPWLIKNFLKSSQSVTTIFPDWLITEWKAMHTIEPQLFPEQQLIQHIPFYTVPESRIGRHYLKLCELYGENVSHVFLAPWLKRGGADLVVLNYVEALSRNRWAKGITVISTLNEDSPWAERLPDGVRFVEFGKLYPHLSMEEQEKLLIRLLVQMAPQVVHNINSDLGYRVFVKYGKALSSISNLYACTFCADVTEEGKAVGYPFTYLPECFDYLNAVFSDNQSFLERLHETYAFDRLKLFTHYQPFPIAERRVFTDKITGKHHMDILWAGRIDWQKRPDILIEIAKKCLDKPITFHVYGKSLLNADLYSAELSSLQNVKRYGHFDGLSSLPLEEYDLFLFTSQWEGLPTILLDAIANGLPVIASKVGGVPELISPGATGFLIDPFDSVDKYVECLSRVLSERESIPAIVANAYDLIAERHSFEKFTEMLLQCPGYISE